MGAKENLGIDGELTGVSPGPAPKPLLMVDIDGVLSLLGGADRGPLAGPEGTGPQGTGPEGTGPERTGRREPEGRFHLIDGIPHFLSVSAASHLLALAPLFDIVWASGWEERADEHLPHLLGLPASLPHVSFAANLRGRGPLNAHWKLGAIDAYAAGRPLAWIDDALDRSCEEWAAARAAPTLLVKTDPARGLTAREERILRSWASGF
jgi:hypothetical protein